MNSQGMDPPKGIASLRQWTMARVALGRTGRSETTEVSLAFKLAHAHAKDAVYAELDVQGLRARLSELGAPVTVIKSKAADRTSFLQRPDWGRLPDDESEKILQEIASLPTPDIVLVIADGLSAIAAMQHAVPLLRLLLPMLRQEGYLIAPPIIALQSRVALGDHVGHILGARLVVMLIGERPGLSAADSLGAYITYQPKPGTTDEARNCISNIRPEGLSYAMAASKLHYLIREALRRGLTGVALKDGSDDGSLLSE